MSFSIFVIAALCVCIGFGLAIIFEKRGMVSWREERPEAEPIPIDLNNEIHSNLVGELLETMRGLAASVDDNVDRHSSRVTEITSEISDETGKDAAIVLAAASRLLEANKQLKSDLETAKAEIKIQERQLNSYMTESRTDELTGVANRRAFEEEIRRRLAQWHREQVPLSLILLDVDRFKWFNDFHGHQTGDVALQQVAQCLRAASRESDLVTRYGGEEFAVILNGTELAEAKSAAECLREAVVHSQLDIDGTEVHLSVSAGVAEALPSETKESFVKRADESLYAAKDDGRNCCHFHDGESSRPVGSGARIEGSKEPIVGPILSDEATAASQQEAGTVS
jgi:diguanylate cyclase